MNRVDPSLSVVSEAVGTAPRVRIAGALAGGGTLALVVALVGVPPFTGPIVPSIGILLLAGAASVVHGPAARRRPAGRFERLGAALMVIGGVIGVTALAGLGAWFPLPLFVGSTGMFCVGSVLLAIGRYGDASGGMLQDEPARAPVTSRGAVAWLLAVVLTGFYVLLYWFPASLEGLIRTADPLSYGMRGRAADQWFLYGLFYSLAVVAMGVRALYRYRHDRYQVIRTISVMFFQAIMAFVLPQLLVLFNQPEFYFTYFWPLKPEYLWPGDWGFGWILEGGGRVGVFMVFWGAVMTVVATPVLTYFYGKRWYCSWVCGCGCLAETAGDPFRRLSDKSLGAWRVERWMIHGVLALVVLTTALLWVNSATDGGVLGGASSAFARVYGFFIGSVFAGVIGVGFYPMMGARVWCRFGCPMAAILGILQKFFSRFRITVNGGQCISCGNCSAYCEMGIDVRWYAQRGQNVIRASCVGCGMCATVCPRGVLRLENGPSQGRYTGAPLNRPEAHGIFPVEEVDVLPQD